MGSRMLGRWILAPLVDREAIVERQVAVQTLSTSMRGAKRCASCSPACFDLERIAQKVRFRRALPRDLASLRRTLDVLRPLPQVRAARARGHWLTRDRRFRPISMTISREA